jgi:hypothetical protein
MAELKTSGELESEPLNASVWLTWPIRSFAKPCCNVAQRWRALAEETITSRARQATDPGIGMLLCCTAT